MPHYIIVARDKNGKVIQTYERMTKESMLDCVASLIDNPTWSLTIRVA